jgi:DUF218 domain
VSSVLKFFGVPGSITFLCLGLALLWALGKWLPSTRRVRNVLAGLLICSYLVLSLPVVAVAIAAALPRSAVVETPVTNPSTRLVVFDGDNRRGRAATTLGIYKTGLVKELWLLGDDWLVDELAGKGIPRGEIRHEDKAPTTRDQVVRTAELAALPGAERTAVVVSRLQAPRVIALLRASRISAEVFAAPIDDEPPTHGFAAWIPRYIGLRVSRDAIYELAALRYYRYRGWIE